MAELFGVLSGEETTIVIDVDETVYTNIPYTQFRSRQELQEAAYLLNVDLSAASAMISAKRAELQVLLSREVTRTETVCALGITPAEWDAVRYRTWQPEKFLSPDYELCRAMQTFQTRTGMRICFATNAPGEKGRKTLEIIGFLTDSLKFFCPENIGCLKPDPQFFLRVAELMHVTPAQCIAVGDRRMSDVDPAIVAGFSYGFVVYGRDDLLSVLCILADGKEFPYGSSQ